MRFRTTKRSNETVSLQEAVFRGLARDGGLYLPEQLPTISDALLERVHASNRLSVVAEMISPLFIGDEWDADEISRLASESFTFDTPLVQVDDDTYLLELFHGPTLSFKDVGARFMATLVKHWLGDSQDQVTILTATSGDTGSAVAQAFHNIRGVRVVLLYPAGKVSTVQEKQFATLGGNVTAIEVEGRFDDCQRLVKESFADEDLRNAVGLTSANSINVARLIPQMFYYISAWGQLNEDEPPIFVVPSGNFGNLTAGVLAHLSGLPVAEFVAATNQNDVVPSYLHTGTYNPRVSVETCSNAMDVGDPSNFERLLTLFDDDHAALTRHLQGCRCTDEETLETMRQVESVNGMVIDPHTAVGMFAAKKYRREKGRAGGATIVLSTAHPAKFPDVVERAIGRKPDVPERLARCLDRTKESIKMQAELDALREVLCG